jgi:hypothetical protein
MRPKGSRPQRLTLATLAQPLDARHERSSHAGITAPTIWKLTFCSRTVLLAN